MWLDLPPRLSLRQQIQDDFDAHRTPTGSVATSPTKRRRKPSSERRDATEAETIVASAGKA